MTGHLPGDRPEEPEDTPERLYVQRASEHGRHELVLGSIRAHLEEQPTAAAAQAAARHWVSDITALGEDVAREKRKAA